MPKLKDLAKSIPSWGKKIVGLVLAGALIFLILEVRSCVKADEDVIYWRGVASVRAKETENIKADLKILEKQRAKDKSDFENEINLKNGEIDSLNTVIVGKMKEVYKRDEEIAGLKKNAGAMSPAVKKFVDALESKVVSLESVIADKDKIIFSITAKYDAAAVRINNLEADIAQYTKIIIPKLIEERDSLTELNKSLSKELAWTKLKSGGKTVVTLASLAAVGYLALKK